MIRVIFSLILVFQLPSCSFSSFQYDFLKSIVYKEDNTQKPKKNWTGFWLEKKIDLYAINLPDQVLFADENINIFFKDKQIYKVTGLISNNSILEINLKNDSLIYNQNGLRLGFDNCIDGQLEIQNTGDQIFSRFCVETTSNRKYENHIIYNSDGMITGLQYKIHPDYPVLRLSIK